MVRLLPFCLGAEQTYFFLPNEAQWDLRESTNLNHVTADRAGAARARVVTVTQLNLGGFLGNSLSNDGTHVAIP